MATIVLSSVGKLFGPLGHLAGTIAGNAIDNALFGPNDIEGARLKELAVTGSSYGTPIPRQYGAMRIPGTIVWSTDLQEHRDRVSNGKGQPKTAHYSYSVSFAVMLSSRPIDRVGRIWADGNLLRGASGDLKSSGTLRVYEGYGDQPRDPLLEATLGAECPAFRGRAYLVIEDLDLTDFGNRIPALSFEVFAGDANALVGELLDHTAEGHRSDADFAQLRGFGHEGGTVRNVLSLVDRLHPLNPRMTEAGLIIEDSASLAAASILPPAAGWGDGEFGRLSGASALRTDRRGSAVASLRYYDPARDYQPAVQHADPADTAARTLQFPGVFAASDALGLAHSANLRGDLQRDTLLWRCCELDPSIGPGSIVKLPTGQALYMVSSWEWREGGVELELVRHRPDIQDVISDPAADPGLPWIPPDRLPGRTELRVFELPWDGFGDPSYPVAYAAPDATSGLWAGCTLQAEREGALVPLNIDTRVRAVTGELTQGLPPSSALRLEPDAQVDVQLLDHEADLPSTDLRGIAQGENRVLVGSEIVQYLTAIPRGDGAFTLHGLLRGRGATELVARLGHDADTPFTLLDERLVVLPPDAIASSTGDFAALSPQDEDAVLAPIENTGRFLKPLPPVHTSVETDMFGHTVFKWVRRARGQWRWLDETEVPLIEETERYEVGCGPISSPYASWTVDTPVIELSAGDLFGLQAQHDIDELWIRQIGKYAKSDPVMMKMSS